MPQTRFVLRKALELQKRVIVVINKIDRPAARPDWVIDSTYELFMDLGASDELCEFPCVYASGVNGIAGMSPDTMAADLGPLFETIVREVRRGVQRPAARAPLQHAAHATVPGGAGGSGTRCAPSPYKPPRYKAAVLIPTPFPTPWHALCSSPLLSAGQAAPGGPARTSAAAVRQHRL